MGKLEYTTKIFVLINLFLYPLLLFSNQMPSTLGYIENVIGVWASPNSGSMTSASIKDQLPINIVSDTAIVGSSEINLVSTMRMVWDFFTWIIGSVIGGLTVTMLMLNFPPMVILFIGVPFSIAQIFGLISAIKGWDL